ncbi:MAG TPA: hypothetical protein VL101_13170, partial [Nordella sp.]|nr:hypothetical protein [Nordella sp.]
KGILKIADGTVTMPASAQSSAVMETRLEPKIDLADGRLDAVLQVKLRALEDEPHFAVTYSGRPDALTRFVDVAALESKLGFKVVERTLKELERLQAEQQKLMEEEDRQRREDETRLENYNEQRREMQRRQKELRVHREMQARQPIVVEEPPPSDSGPVKVEEPPPADSGGAQAASNDPSGNDPTEVQPLLPDTGDTAIFGPPPPPKAKPQAKRPSPAKAQARSDPGAPLVLVPPQKYAPPAKEERSFFDRLFGRKP